MLLITASSELRFSVSVSRPLRLDEQPRVLERDAHARRDRLDQPDVRVAKRVLALVVREVDEPRHLSPLISGTMAIERSFSVPGWLKLP
jgi:hypothetical protein